MEEINRKIGKDYKFPEVIKEIMRLETGQRKYSKKPKWRGPSRGKK